MTASRGGNQPRGAQPLRLLPVTLRLPVVTWETREDLKIYDPYYCMGACVRHMAALGVSALDGGGQLRT